MSSYRPRYNDASRFEDFPPPPPPSDLPPLPPGPPPMKERWGRGDSWRPNVPSRPHFTFIHSDTGPSYPTERDYQQGPPDCRPRDKTRQYDRHRDNRNLNSVNRGGYVRNNRGPQNASNRPLLTQHHHRDDESTEVLGFAEGAAKYLNVEDVDTSDGEVMDQSDSDRELGVILNGSFDRSADNRSEEPPAKRQNLGDGNSKPKWSNPDPYSVLPPIDESVGKRKDPVEEIRKYRKAGEDGTSATVNQVAANDDFISFDMGTDTLNGVGDSSVVAEENYGNGAHSAPRAPKQPRSKYTETHTNNDRHQITPDDTRTRSSTSTDGLARVNCAPPPGTIVLDTEDEVGYQVFNDPRILGDVPHPHVGRKRNRDDQIKGHVPKVPPHTSLLESWQPTTRINLLPWLAEPKYVKANPGFRLHMEICDFFDYVRPQRFEENVREDLLGRLEGLVKNSFPFCSVHVFGSFAAGLYLPNADMDVVVMSDSYINKGMPQVCQSNNKLYAFGSMIRQSGIAKANSVDVIAHAKVPLVKFVDRRTAIRVDMSFENDSGVIAINTFHGWKRQYPAMPVLVTVIKQFLSMRGLNEVQHGGLGGFSVTCLVTSLLQNMPRVQSGELVPEDHIGEILMEFLDFYGNRLDISRTGISMDPPGYYDKQALNRSRNPRFGPKPSLPDRIAIMDPHNSGNDISGGSKRILTIFDKFAMAHRHILNAMNNQGRPSLLDWMLGGNYTGVMKQRNHLKALYDGGFQALKEALTDDDIAHDDDINSVGGRAQLNRGEDRKRALQREFPDMKDISPQFKKHQITAPMGTCEGKENVMMPTKMNYVPDPSMKPRVLPAVSQTRPPSSASTDDLPHVRIMSSRQRAASLKKSFPAAADQIPIFLDRTTFADVSKHRAKKSVSQAGTANEQEAQGQRERADTLTGGSPQAASRIPDLVYEKTFNEPPAQQLKEHCPGDVDSPARQHSRADCLKARLSQATAEIADLLDRHTYDELYKVLDPEKHQALHATTMKQQCPELATKISTLVSKKAFTPLSRKLRLKRQQTVRTQDTPFHSMGSSFAHPIFLD